MAVLLALQEELLIINYRASAKYDIGANWLSLKNEVLNPNFGDMMLNCGEITSTIEKNRYIEKN